MSAVIPCYNAAPFLRETIKSVLDQTLPVQQVVVVDDGSTDDSAAIAESFGPRVKVIRQTNQGESVARNRGIDASTGEWVALLDADDLWLPQKLERQFSRDPQDAVCLFTHYRLLTPSGMQSAELSARHDEGDDFIVNMLLSWAVLPSTAVIKRAAAREVRFPEWTSHSEDMIFFLMLRRHGAFTRNDEPLCTYRKHEKSQSSNVAHAVKSVASRWEWFCSNQDAYSPDEQQRVREGLFQALLDAHKQAYWRREIATVGSCRSLMREIDAERSRAEPALRRPLLPRWAYRLRDCLSV